MHQLNEKIKVVLSADTCTTIIMVNIQFGPVLYAKALLIISHVYTVSLNEYTPKCVYVGNLYRACGCCEAAYELTGEICNIITNS